MGPDEFDLCNADELAEILAAGDVASMLYFADHLDESPFQDRIEPLVRTCQNLGVAAVVADHSRIAGRVRADGLQLGADRNALQQAIEKFHPTMMIGAGNIKTRHAALTLGEAGPDYLMFGKPGSDTRAEPHPKNVALGEWWSSLVEIPCIVLGGTRSESAISVARCGAEFVALRKAVFSPDPGDTVAPDAAGRVRQINQLLNQHAPPLEDVSY